MNVRRSFFSWVAVGLAALPVLFLLTYLPIAENGDLSVCASRRFLHFSCPGCGLTRAFASLATGDFHAALRFHPLGPVFLLEGILIWAGWGLVLAGVLRYPASATINRWLFLQLFLLLGVWVIRLLTGTLPD